MGHGKIAWSSDGKFEEIAIVALNWQSWLDENHDSKKYLALCKELAKTNFADTKTVKHFINGNVFKRGVLPYGWTSSSIGVSYQKCYGPQFLADIWRCNDQIIKFIIQKFNEDLYWPDYHLRTPIFRILAENKLHILVEMKDMVNFDGILYQLGFVRFYLQMHF